MDSEMKLNAGLVRKLRENRAWSQDHLAAAAGLSLRTVQRIEAEGNASLESRLSLAAALQVDAATLVAVAEAPAGFAARQFAAPEFAAPEFAGAPDVVRQRASAVAGVGAAEVGISGVDPDALSDTRLGATEVGISGVDADALSDARLGGVVDQRSVAQTRRSGLRPPWSSRPRVGLIVGTVASFIGATVGITCAWIAASQGTHSSAELGITQSVLATVFGLTCAALATVWNRFRQQS
jgi:transcriptional regulator with XRE-family HTH domain